jgi:RNA polymerase sigma-70 factor, ECF subfamily
VCGTSPRVSAISDPDDQAGFVALVRSLERPVGSFLAQMTDDRGLAADLMQETFLVLWRERHRLPADPALHRAWVFGVARNRALGALRRRRRGAAALDRLAVRAARAPAPAGEDEALAMRDLLVRTLRPVDRSLFVLRYVHGFDGPELAALTGMKPDAVRKRLQRAGERLVEAGELVKPTLKEGPRHVRFDASV